MRGIQRADNTHTKTESIVPELLHRLAVGRAQEQRFVQIWLL